MNWVKAALVGMIFFFGSFIFFSAYQLIVFWSELARVDFWFSWGKLVFSLIGIYYITKLWGEWE